MKYISQFADINDKIYTIEIVTNNSTSQTQELLLGENPLVIQTKSENIFYELKFRTARISLITNEYLNDIYNPSATGTSVTIKSDNEVIFYGYVTPNTYSQDYNNPLDELEIECIEDVSILKYYDYSTVGSQKTIITIRQLLNNVFRKLNNPYTKYYVFPNTIKLNSSVNIDTIYVNENNFFDNDSEQKPWKCDEVIKEVCKYFNLSCTKDKDTIYFIDYSALKENKTSCSKVNFTANTLTTINVETNKHSLTETDSADSDCSISKDDTYNEIRITSNSYPIDDYVVPQLYTDNDFNSWTNKFRNGNNYVRTEYYKSYNDNVWKQHYYDFITKQEVSPFTLDGRDYKQERFGIYGKIMKTAFVKSDTDEVSLNFQNHLTFCLGIPHCEKHSSTVTIDNIYYYYDDNYDLLEQVQKANQDCDKVCLELQSRNNEYIYSPVKGTSYLLFSGEGLFSSYENPLYVTDKDLYEEWAMYVDSSSTKSVISVELKIGDKYWNGSQWTSTKSTFTLDFSDETGLVWNKEMQIANNVTIDMGIEKKGLAIPMKASDNLFGTLSIKLYKPMINGFIPGISAIQTIMKKLIPYYFHIKDFEIEFFNSKGDGYYWIDEDNSEDDTEYFNIINENYVTEFNDMELKINTQNPDKKLSVSSTMYNDGNTMKYITTLNDTVLNTTRLQENNIIERYYNHYSTPKNIIERTIYNYYKPTNLFNWRQFNNMCIDTQNWNVKYNTNNIKLIEI